MNEHERQDEPTMEGLKSLPRQKDPPPELFDRIVMSLKGQGLIGPRSSFTFQMLIRPLAVALILLVFLLSGLLLREWYGRGDDTSSNRPLFVLLLYGAETESSAGGEQVQEYSAWIRKVRESGRVATGEKLKDSARVLQLVDGNLEVRARFLEAQPQIVLGGYFLIEAVDYAEAVRIAAECPHLKYGGLIELREIETTTGG